MKFGALRICRIALVLLSYYETNPYTFLNAQEGFEKERPEFWKSPTRVTKPAPTYAFLNNKRDY